MPRGMLLALAVSAVVLALTGNAAAQGTWKKFTHPQYGFSLQYPSGWNANSGKAPFVFEAVGPLVAGMNSFRINVHVVMVTVPAGLTVERFEAVNESRITLPGYQHLRTDRTTVGNVPALLRYVTWWPNDTLEAYQIQLNVVSSGRGYVVTGTTSTQSARLQQEADLLVRILRTFRVR